jgi:hypothetical protein
MILLLKRKPLLTEPEEKAETEASVEAQAEETPEMAEAEAVLDPATDAEGKPEPVPAAGYSIGADWKR